MKILQPLFVRLVAPVLRGLDCDDGTRLLRHASRRPVRHPFVPGRPPAQPG